MNYFQSTKKDEGGAQPTITTFWTNSNPTASLDAFTLNVDITQHDYIRIKYKLFSDSVGDPYEVIYPTNEIPSTSVFQGGITRIGPGSYRTDSRFIQKSNQTLTVTGVYSNGQLNIVNNGTLIITALEFIDDVTL